MFVLAIGLMSVAALIPVGKFQMVEASKFDRSTATARGAMQELRVRGYVEPGNWLNYQGSEFGTTASSTTIPARSPFAWVDVDEPSVIGIPALPQPLCEYGIVGAPAILNIASLPPNFMHSLGPLARGNAVCIDPLFIASNPCYQFAPSGTAVPGWQSITESGTTYYNDPAVGVFPYPLKNDPHQDDSTAATRLFPDQWTNAPRMQRVTLRTPGIDSRYAMELPIARRTFIWQDELVFDSPRDDAKRPVWSTTRAEGGTFTPVGVVPPISQRTASDYSWFATIVPDDASQSTEETRSVTASVAVVYKRDVGFLQRGDVPSIWGSPNFYTPAPGQRPAPEERVVHVDFLSSGHGGGEVRLRLPIQSGAPNDFAAQPDKSDFPAVRLGQWILVTAWTQPDIIFAAPGPALATATAPFDPNAFPPNRRAVFRWYRVVNVGPVEYKENLFDPVDHWCQNVALSGPDWDPDQFLDADQVQSIHRHASTTGTTPPELNGRTAYAILVRGVVAVYEQTIAIGQE